MSQVSDYFQLKQAVCIICFRSYLGNVKTMPLLLPHASYDTLDLKVTPTANSKFIA